MDFDHGKQQYIEIRGIKTF